MLNTYLNLGILAVLVAIPFYFQIWIRSRKTWVISEVNAKTARLSCLNLGLLFLSSFLASHEKQNQPSLIVFGASIFSFLLLFSFRTKVIQHIRKIEVTSKEQFIRSLRSFGGFFGSMGLYYLIVFELGRFIGTLPAVAIATLVVIGTAPLMVRILFSCHRMHPSPLKDEIFSIFQKAGVKLGEIYLMDTDKFKMSNALVCGSKYGFGPMKRSLFLTQNLFHTLDEDELRAVLCHEASHFQLHHIAKRGLSAFLALLAAFIFVMFPIGMIAVTIQSKEWISALSILSLIINLIFQFIFIFRVIRKQEYEADLNAVKLGATPQALIGALEKITQFNGGHDRNEDWITRHVMGNAHPSLEERRDALLTQQIPKSARILPEPRFIASYAVIVLVIGTWFVNANKDSILEPNREIASEKKTGQ